jgi:hypothetical protein
MLERMIEIFEECPLTVRCAVDQLSTAFLDGPETLTVTVIASPLVDCIRQFCESDDMELRAFAFDFIGRAIDIAETCASTEMMVHFCALYADFIDIVVESDDTAFGLMTARLDSFATRMESRTLNQGR